MALSRPDTLLALARTLADRRPDFHEVKGPGTGDRATNLYMAELRSAAIDAFQTDLSEFRGCGETSLAADFYFPEEGVLVEIALGLPNPNTEFEKDILKALMTKEHGNRVSRLLFISRPGASKKCDQPGRKAMINWAFKKHGIQIEVQELNGEPRPPRVRKRRRSRPAKDVPSAV